ncbi:MAG: UPF0280 family protein [Archaeoglobaceae archaeon]
MKRYRFAYRETVVSILTESDEFYEIAVEAILEARSEIERYIVLHPEFYTSYEPVECHGSEIIERMCRAAKIANVGPMASVAAAVAAHAVRKMSEAGAKLAVVDNGGDIVFRSDRELKIGVYPTEIAIVLEPREFYAVCTSSGKIGHSVSFGYADAACVLGEEPEVCDALATALGNAVKKDFGKEELKSCVADFFETYSDYVDAILVAKDDLIAYAGDLKLVPAKIDYDLITKG